jgi:hypothetical protein
VHGAESRLQRSRRARLARAANVECEFSTMWRCSIVYLTRRALFCGYSRIRIETHASQVQSVHLSDRIASAGHRAGAPGGMMRSISTRSSAVSTISAARTFSSRCFRDFAPGIGTMKAPARKLWAIGQAMESWASVAFFPRDGLKRRAQSEISLHWRCESEAVARECLPPPFPLPWVLASSASRARVPHRTQQNARIDWINSLSWIG